MTDTPPEKSNSARYSLWQSPSRDKARVMISYRGLQLNILWVKADDESDHGDMDALISALPGIWKTVHAEIHYQDEIANLDTELDDLFRKKEGEEE